MASNDLLFELGCEELPAQSLSSLETSLLNLFKQALTAYKLTHKNIITFATPRRLGLWVTELTDQQPDQESLKLGPNVNSAYNQDGTPTKAGLGFAKSCKVPFEQLATKRTDKGERLAYSSIIKGKKTIDLLPELIKKTLQKLPNQKTMRWGNNTFNFIRPVHWLLLIYGGQTITTNLFGLTTSNKTYGHRFLYPKEITITDPKQYIEKLKNPGFVIASFNERKNQIKKNIEALCAEDEEVLLDKNLLNEVTSLVEWPVVMQGTFKSDYLKIPPEVLITSMQTHQKCFAITDQKGQLKPKFILISNIQSHNPEIVIRGNERVIDARLSDAAFFFHQDVKKPLETLLPQLQHVIYQDKLGSLHDKAERISILSGFIAKQLNSDITLAERAALLCKCDLLTGMVGEFPNLQGIMGYYYALHANEDRAIACGIKEHYLPRFAGDKLPATIIGSIVGLADKVDTLVGIIGINELPTGDKDPFALRRNAHGILRLLIEEQLPLNLSDLIKQSIDNYSDKLINKNVLQQTIDFITERLRYWYLDQNTPAQVFEAVLAKHPKAPLDFHGRVNAVMAFQKLPEANALAAANKRVSNILKKENIVLNKPNIDPTLFEHEEENNLISALTKHQDIFDSYYQHANYTEALQSLAALKQPIDNFFDKVMVMTDNSNVRNNRLAILVSLHNIFSKVADISLLS